MFGLIALIAAGVVVTPPVEAHGRDAGAIQTIRHVNVVDIRKGVILPDQDVTLLGQRIVTVSPASPTRPAGQLVDGRGKFLMPGLWDCHVHLSWTTSSALPLLIALGVTEVRDLGSKFSEIEGWRARIASGDLVGPHILRVGPILNGKAFNAYQFVPGSAEAARGDVRLLTYLGVDEIKVHRRMPRDWYLAILNEAKTQHIPVVGHIPVEVEPREASDAGQYMIEHTETLLEGTFAKGLPDDQLPTKIRSWLATDEPDMLFQEFVKNGTWVDPTLSGYLEAGALADPAATRGPLYRYVAASQLKQFDEAQRQHPPTAQEVSTLRDHVTLLIDITARMHRNHVRLVAGTDAAGPRLVGFSLHQELIDLVRAGLTPAEALRAATLNPAEAFGKTADLGAVEPGKLADLVLLDADPLADVANTQKIEAVFQDGRRFDRHALDNLLARAQRLAAVQ